jgi:chromosome segregation ATPase
MKLSSTLVLGAVACASGEDTEVNPLEQAVKLCQDLSANIEKDGEAEAKAYQDYFEWCDDTAKEKQFEIKTAKSQKEKLEASINEFASTAEAADTRIAELAAAISNAEKDLKGATWIREKEAANFATGQKELEEAVDTLSRAVGVLEREMAKGAAAFAQVASGPEFTNMLASLSVVIDAAAF